MNTVERKMYICVRTFKGIEKVPYWKYSLLLSKSEVIPPNTVLWAQKTCFKLKM